jgi:aspartate/methionine/tyrosine aminotransferase
MDIDFSVPGFRSVPQTGVIYVMSKAVEKGFSQDSLEWANLGQGAPEVGSFNQAVKRIEKICVDESCYEYGPVSGQKELRQQVAELYNSLYRQGKKSKYTWENVSISGGGRLALTRLAACLGNINIGHFLPDYTAYEELLSVFKAFVPIPILFEVDSNYAVTASQIKQKIMGLGLKAILVSNPCNPTGQVIAGETLNELVSSMREYGCTFIFDEFYSHYIYDEESIKNSAAKTVSAAEYVQDVNLDPIMIIDGLTKNWRYPGWRLSWTLGPKEAIKSIESAGSFLDGGASNLLQKEAIPLLEPAYVLSEIKALQSCFLEKRNYMLRRLSEMGIEVEVKPQGTFYVWANLGSLPGPLTEGCYFFDAGLDEKVITVPGVFFDVNPEKRRALARFSQHVRISFGPEMHVLERGLDAIERLIKSHS